MVFFQIDWRFFPGDEGDRWQRVQRVSCATCGLRVAPFANRFMTPDDNIIATSLILDAIPVPPIFRIGGLYFVTEAFSARLEKCFPGAFLFFAAEVDRRLDGECRDNVLWAKATGRLAIKPLYYRICDPCPECRHRRQERIEPRPSIPNFEIVQDSWSGACLYHAEETGSPNFVDGRFKDFLEQEVSDFPEQLVLFKEVHCVQ